MELLALLIPFVFIAVVLVLIKGVWTAGGFLCRGVFGFLHGSLVDAKEERERTADWKRGEKSLDKALQRDLVRQQKNPPVEQRAHEVALKRAEKDAEADGRIALKKLELEELLVQTRSEIETRQAQTALQLEAERARLQLELERQRSGLEFERQQQAALFAEERRRLAKLEFEAKKAMLEASGADPRLVAEMIEQLREQYTEKLR